LAASVQFGPLLAVLMSVQQGKDWRIGRQKQLVVKMNGPDGKKIAGRGAVQPKFFRCFRLF
jgi:hypothetical protein